MEIRRPNSRRVAHGETENVERAHSANRPTQDRS